MDDKIVGGLSDNLSVFDVVKKHSKVLNKLGFTTEKEKMDKINKELSIGMRVEMEHTDDKSLAREIAIDHLYESPIYYTELKKTVDKPLISFLPPCYSRMDDKGVDFDFKHINDNELDIINIPKAKLVTAEYWPHYSGYDDERHIDFKCTNAIILYGGFVFSEGQWIIDIEQDPEHYYTGEEFALSIRSYTHGYDIYTPHQIIAWHRAHPKTPKKHYNNNPEEISNAKHRHAIERLRMLIEGGDLGKYGPGNIRTIEQYGEFANIDFKNKKLIREI